MPRNARQPSIISGSLPLLCTKAAGVRHGRAGVDICSNVCLTPIRETYAYLSQTLKYILKLCVYCGGLTQGSNPGIYIRTRAYVFLLFLLRFEIISPMRS